MIKEITGEIKLCPIDDGYGGWKFKISEMSLAEWFAREFFGVELGEQGQGVVRKILWEGLKAGKYKLTLGEVEG